MQGNADKTDNPGNWDNTAFNWSIFAILAGGVSCLRLQRLPQSTWWDWPFEA